MNIEFLEETHTYLVNGIQVPCVSNIMELISNKYYEGIDDYILDKACVRGSAVHKATELLDQNLPYNIKKEWECYVLQWKIFKKLKKVEIISIEQKLTNGEFCGTIDRIILLKIDGFTYLIDIKTSAKINDKLVSVQLGGYKILADYNKIKVDKYAVVHLTKTGYKLQEIEPNEHIFNCLLETYKYNNQI